MKIFYAFFHISSDHSDRSHLSTFLATDGKAYSSNSISPQILGKCVLILAFLFGFSIKTQICTSWKYTLIQPTHQTGDRSNHSGCCLTSLFSAISRVFETFLNSQFCKHSRILLSSLSSQQQFFVVQGLPVIFCLMWFIQGFWWILHYGLRYLWFFCFSKPCYA